MRRHTVLVHFKDLFTGLLGLVSCLSVAVVIVMNYIQVFLYYSQVTRYAV